MTDYRYHSVNNLNVLVFNELSIYLLYNQNKKTLSSYKTILELSLISKSTFKIFQNLITSHPLNKHLFILPKITQFIKYINLDNSNNNYIYKLIKYKEIDEIRFFNISGEIYNNKQNQLYSELCKIDNSDNDKLSYMQILRQSIDQGDEVYDDSYKQLDDSWSDEINCHEISYFILKRMKSFLNETCPYLKKVIIVDAMKPFRVIPFDFTFGGFYQVRKLNLHWESDEIGAPISSASESSRYSDSNDFDFSFNFVSKYKPIKIQIQTASIGEDTNLQVSDTSYNNLIHACSQSLESISHFDYLCSSYSLESIISSNSPIIKSLVIEHYYLHSLNPLYDALRNSLTTNTTLKKFILDDYTVNNSFRKMENIEPMFEILKLNKSLTALGINHFKLKDYTVLSPLIQCKNITILYTNVFNLEITLAHCIQNKNIKQLHLVDKYNGEKNQTMSGIISEEKIFYKYLSETNNTSSLDTIKLKGGFSLNYFKLKKELDELGKNLKNFPNIVISKKQLINSLSDFY